MKHPSLHRRCIAAILVPVALATLSSCNMSSTEEYRIDDSKPVNVIASIDLMSQGKIDFIEEEPGCLITVGTFTDVDFFSPYKDLNPVELYETFKGEAPEKLKKAYHTAQLAAEKNIPDNPVPEFSPNPDPDNGVIAKKAYSGTYFREHYCIDHSFDFEACYPARNENLTFVKDCAYMKAYVNTITDTAPVVFRTYYYTNNWVLARRYDVPKGILLTYAVAGARKYRMFTMRTGVSIGDFYNISIMGNYELD